MSIRSQLLSDLKLWFNGYVGRFTSDDPKIQENFDLKAMHTLRVCAAARDIGTSLELSETDLRLAEISALLHDIGRFEQYRTYRTFVDSKSENHAALGVKILQTEYPLQNFDPADAETILKLVQCHNRAVLPPDESDRFLFFLKLLRDADKVDIWHVVTEYYGECGRSRNQGLELDLPDEDRVSDGACEALMQGRLVKMTELETLNDFKLMQLAWIYDLNFPRTFEIVKERRYLEKIRQALPKDSQRVTEIYQQVCGYLERNCLS